MQLTLTVNLTQPQVRKTTGILSAVFMEDPSWVESPSLMLLAIFKSPSLPEGLFRKQAGLCLSVSCLGFGNRANSCEKDERAALVLQLC